MKMMTHTMSQCVEEMIEVLREHADRGEAVNMLDVSQGLTLDVIAKCALAWQVCTVKRIKFSSFIILMYQTVHMFPYFIYFAGSAPKSRIVISYGHASVNVPQKRLIGLHENSGLYGYCLFVLALVTLWPCSKMYSI